MKIAIIGGGLQGIEVTYLAQKAGYQVLLVDRKNNVPASSLVDSTLICDVTKDKNKLLKRLESVDIIFPTTENEDALQALKNINSKIDTPIVFDWKAYQLTSSKERSKNFFRKENIPQPESWPKANFPLIIKPSQGSGSKDVYKVANKKELNKILTKLDGIVNNFIIEESLIGPSFSMEVIAYSGQIIPLVTTFLEFDSNYDCKRVIISKFIEPKIEKKLADLCIKIVQRLSINGIMDLEAIVDNNQIKVLEIDARFPSQTPVTVFWSTNLNMVEMLCDLYLGHTVSLNYSYLNKSVIYEHIRVKNKRINVCGEHVLSSAMGLEVISDFFGANEAITNYDPINENWVATLIFKEDCLEEVIQQRNITLNKIISEHSLYEFQDLMISNKDWNWREKYDSVII
jgi:pyrrolysine biosynthesis protein PylC